MNLPWRKNCHLHTCLWPEWSPHPLQGNMCCLGRYKGVILLLGTSPLRSHFISLFSRHRSLYLISYSRAWLPQTGPTPFIFIWKTHLMLERWQSREFCSGRDSGKFLYHMLKDHFQFISAWCICHKCGHCGSMGRADFVLTTAFVAIWGNDGSCRAACIGAASASLIELFK